MLLFSALVLTKPARAETPRQHETAAWTGVMTDVPVQGPWSFFADTHFNSQAFLVLRGGLTWRSLSGPTLTSGYAHLWTNPGDGSFSRNEHRPWVQAFLPFGFADKWTLSERFRGELRWQQNIQQGQATTGFAMTPRFRTQTAVSYWFGSLFGLKFFTQGAVEVLVNGGQNAGPNFLDQTRLSLMLGYRKGPTTVRVGYMDRFIPGRLGVAPKHEHDVIFWINFKAPGRHIETVAVPEGGNP